MSVDNTALIARLEEVCAEAREALDDFRRNQDAATADEANESHIMVASAGLDQFEGAITDLVP